MSSTEISNTTPPAPPVQPLQAVHTVSDIHKNSQSPPGNTPDAIKPAGDPKSTHQLLSSVAAANSMLQAANRAVEFQVDQTTKKLVVKVVDNQTGTTLMQIPSEEMLNFAQRVADMPSSKGSIIQQKA